MAATFTVIFALGVMGIGDLQGKEMMKAQPAKAAAAEAVWETTKGAPMYLFAIPDEANERNSVELFGIPKLLSWGRVGGCQRRVQGIEGMAQRGETACCHNLLVFSFDGGHGHALCPGQYPGMVEQEDPGSFALASQGAGIHHSSAVHRTRVRLDGYRSGASAVDCVRSDENRGCSFDLGRKSGGIVPHSLYRCVLRAWGDLLLAHK